MNPRSLRGLLWPILPDAVSSDFLRACLASDAGAFSRWCRRVADPEAFLKSEPNDRHRALLPLLERSLKALDRPPPELHTSFLTALRTSALHERARSENLVRVFGDVARALSAAEIDVLAVGGIAVAHTAYPEPGLRHGSTLSLVVDPDRIGEARARLEARGCVRRDSELCHPAGPPIRPRATALRHAPISAWSGTVPLRIGETQTQTVSLEISVLERCEEALIGGSARNLNWVCDLWFLTEQCTPGVWSRIESISAGHGSALVAAEVLSYLHGLGAAVPAAVIDRMKESAAGVAPSRVGALLHAASRSSATGPWAWLRGCGAASDRIRLLRYGLGHRARRLFAC